MAPECIHNKASEKVSDIYSLSGVFYFLKVGSPPFAGGSEYLVFTKSLETHFQNVNHLFTSELFDLLQKMNEKDMDKRINI
jgi:serine/threonine protein kinase